MECVHVKTSEFSINLRIRTSAVRLCKDVYMETRDHVYWGAYLYVWLVILAAGIHVQHEPADTCIF